MKQTICIIFIAIMFSITGCQPTCEELERRMDKTVKQAVIVASVHGTGKAIADRIAVANIITTWNKTEEEFKQCCPEAYKKWKYNPIEGLEGGEFGKHTLWGMNFDDGSWIERIEDLSPLYTDNDIKAVISYIKDNRDYFTPLKTPYGAIITTWKIKNYPNWRLIRLHGDYKKYLIHIKQMHIAD